MLTAVDVDGVSRVGGRDVAGDRELGGVGRTTASNVNCTDISASQNGNLGAKHTLSARDIELRLCAGVVESKLLNTKKVLASGDGRRQVRRVCVEHRPSGLSAAEGRPLGLELEPVGTRPIPLGHITRGLSEVPLDGALVVDGGVDLEGDRATSSDIENRSARARRTTFVAAEVVVGENRDRGVEVGVLADVLVLSTAVDPRKAVVGHGHVGEASQGDDEREQLHDDGLEGRRWGCVRCVVGEEKTNPGGNPMLFIYSLLANINSRSRLAFPTTPMVLFHRSLISSYNGQEHGKDLRFPRNRYISILAYFSTDS